MNINVSCGIQRVNDSNLELDKKRVLMEITKEVVKKLEEYHLLKYDITENFVTCSINIEIGDLSTVR